MSRLGAILVATAALLLAWLGPWPGGASLYPDLPLLAVILVATQRPPLEAWTLAAATGLAEDALSTAPFGGRGLVLVLVAVLAHGLAGRCDVASIPGRMLLLAGAALAAETMSALVAHLCQPAVAAPPPGSMVAVLARAGGLALLGCLLWPAPGRGRAAEAR